MKPTVLIVDDQPGTRRLLRNVLEGDGYAVIEAGDEAGAWRAVQGCDQSLGLALIDVDLPGLNGRYVADHLQLLRPLPVVFMSGHTKTALMADGRLERGAAWLAKPFRLRDVREAVGRELQ
jgi:CheY-like chemotaxis protein